VLLHPKDQNLNAHCSENLKYDNINLPVDEPFGHKARKFKNYFVKKHNILFSQVKGEVNFLQFLCAVL
jgi:nitrate reductase alpha subunit